MSTTKNMTSGNPYRLILLFSLPLMAGSIFQELYTITDTAIVGRSLGVDALAALGAVAWQAWLFQGVIQGITQGFSILVAQRFGAGRLEEMREAVGNAFFLSSVSALLLLAVAQLSLVPFLGILGVPDQIRHMGTLYLRVLFCGLPAVVAYNIFSAVLRALGDARNPLYAMVLASCTNVGLDLLFVIVFHWGVAGAAGATVLAQLLSALFCLWKIRRLPELRMTRAHLLHPRLSLIRRMAVLAAPMAFQNLVIAVGGIIVQMVVNRYGVAFIAGYTTTTKMYGLLESAAISYGFAMVTYTGQNIGAGDEKRVSEGLRASLVIALITSAVIAVLLFLLGRNLLGLFMDVNTAQGQEALRVGYLFLRIMAVFLPVLYVLHVVRSCIQGMGNTVIPMVSGLAEFVMRVGTALLMPALFGETGILFAEVIAWAGADAVLIPGYLREAARS